MSPVFRNWLIIMNVIAIFYGFAMYAPQLANTNPLFWIFVPDCPLATVFFTASLMLLALNKKSNILFLLSMISGFKYGVWTCFAIVSYWNFYVAPSNFIDYVIDFSAHVGLFLEQFLLIKYATFNVRKLIAPLAFLFFNDLSDYLLATHPLLPEYSLSFMFPFTVSLTVASAAFTYAILTRA